MGSSNYMSLLTKETAFIKPHFQLTVSQANEVSALLSSLHVPLGRDSSTEATQGLKRWMLLGRLL